MATSNPSSCPAQGTLELAINSELDEAGEKALAEHIETCEDCREKLQSLAGAGVLPQEGSYESASSDDRSDSNSALNRVMARMRDRNAAEAMLDRDRWRQMLQPCELPSVIGLFGNYHVLECVGQGGMGIVLKARDPSLDRIVAVKVLHPELAVSETARQRFIREAKAAAAVNHEHVVTIHAVDKHNGLPYLVMEFIQGTCLQEKIEENGPLPLAEILRISGQIARGLAAAHEQGLIHRDIKPANILLENGVARVKVTDFGLAKAVDDVTLTKSGTVAGTPQYMSPEQANESTVDHRADLFSLGSVMYTMCTGEPAFRGDSTVGVLRKVCDQDPGSVRTRNSEIPAALASVVTRLMHKNPNRRYQTATEAEKVLIAQLAALESGEDLKRFARPTWPLPVAVTCIVLLGLVAIAWLSGLLPLHRSANNTLTASSVSAEPKPFRVEETDFKSLQDAVAAAKEDGVIEIHGNGPYRVGLIDLGSKSLTIRAARESRPVLVGTNELTGTVFVSRGQLRLDGLVIRSRREKRLKIDVADAANEAAVQCENGPFRISNCEIFAGGATGCVWLKCLDATVVDCFLHAPVTGGVNSVVQSGSSLTIENSVLVSRAAIGLRIDEPLEDSMHLRVAQSTIVAKRFVLYFQGKKSRARHHVSDLDPRDSPLLDIQTNGVLFDVDTLFHWYVWQHANQMKSMPTKRVDALRTHLAWEEKDNFYADPFDTAAFANVRMEGLFFENDHDWFQFCGQSNFEPLIGNVTLATGPPKDVTSYAIRSTEPAIPNELRIGADTKRIGQ